MNTDSDNYELALFHADEASRIMNLFEVETLEEAQIHATLALVYAILRSS